MLTKAELISELTSSSRLNTFVPVFVELGGKKIQVDGVFASAIQGKTFTYLELPNRQDIYKVADGKAEAVKGRTDMHAVADELDPEPDEILKANEQLAKILGAIPKGYSLSNGKLVRNRVVGESPKPARAKRGTGKSGGASENGTFKSDAVGMKIVRTNDGKTLTVKSVSATGKAVLDDGTSIGRLNRYYKKA